VVLPGRKILEIIAREVVDVRGRFNFVEKAVFTQNMAAVCCFQQLIRP